MSQICFIFEYLYMFQMVFPSIIRTSRLYIQQQAYVKQILPLFANGNKMELSISFSLANSGGICLTYACCCMYSHELLMMDRKTIQNM